MKPITPHRRALPVLFFALALSPALRAEVLPQAGRWRVDRVKQDLRAQPWGPSCGAKPKGHDWKVSADEFDLLLQGREFVLKSKRRQLASKGCEGHGHKLTLVEHQAQGGQRNSECEWRDDEDQVLEKVSQRLQLVDDSHILLHSEGFWHKQPPRKPEEPLLVGGDEQVWYSDGNQWKRGSKEDAQRAQRCIVHFVREEKIERIVAAEAACHHSGPPKRLRLEPQTTDLTAGQRLCFQPKAQDIDGCPASPPALTFSLQPPDLGQVDQQGCVSVAQDLAQPAALALQAKALGFEASALIRVSPKTHADDSTQKQQAVPDLKTLVTQSQNAQVKKVAKDLIGDIRVGEVALRSSQSPSSTQPHGALAHPTASSTWWITSSVVVIIAVIFVFAMWSLRRSRQLREASARAQQEHDAAVQNAETRRREKKAQGPAAPMATRAALPQQGQGLVCPKCHFEFEDGKFCPFDQTPLEPLERQARHTLFIPISGGMVCPVCNTRYPSKARFCGKDRSPLLPASLVDKIK